VSVTETIAWLDLDPVEAFSTALRTDGDLSDGVDALVAIEPGLDRAHVERWLLDFAVAEIESGENLSDGERSIALRWCREIMNAGTEVS